MLETVFCDQLTHILKAVHVGSCSPAGMQSEGKAEQSLSSIAVRQRVGHTERRRECGIWQVGREAKFPINRDRVAISFVNLCLYDYCQGMHCYYVQCMYKCWVMDVHLGIRIRQ